jgi:hypothetical protein
VLAALNGVGPPAAWVVVGEAVAAEPEDVLEGDVASHTATPATTAPISTMVRSWVRLGRRTKWPHERDRAAKGFQREPPLIRPARRRAVDGRSRLSFRTPPFRTL